MTDRKWVALLDERGIYQGKQQLGAGQPLPPGAVEVPADCDLVPGRYQWLGDRFVPLRARKLSVEDLHMRAVHAFVVSMIDWSDAWNLTGTGPEIPAYVREWAAWYGGKLAASPDYPLLPAAGDEG